MIISNINFNNFSRAVHPETVIGIKKEAANDLMNKVSPIFKKLCPGQGRQKIELSSPVKGNDTLLQATILLLFFTVIGLLVFLLIERCQQPVAKVPPSAETIAHQREEENTSPPPQRRNAYAEDLGLVSNLEPIRPLSHSDQYEQLFNYWPD